MEGKFERESGRERNRWNGFDRHWIQALQCAELVLCQSLNMAKEIYPSTGVSRKWKDLLLVRGGKRSEVGKPHNNFRR